MVHMNQTDIRGRGIAGFCSWCCLGAAIGLATSYFVYASKPAVFESSAFLKISRVAPSETGQAVVQNSVTDPVGESHEQAFVSGVRMSDNASEDVLLDGLDQSDVGQTLRVDESSTETLNRKPIRDVADVDDSTLLASEAVLAKAISVGQLAKLQDLPWAVGVRERSPEVLSRELLRSGDLSVKRLDRTSLGSVYRVAFRSRLPSTSKKVVDSIAEAAVQSFDTSTAAEQIQKKIDLLTNGRDAIDQLSTELRRDLDQLVLPPDAMLRSDEVVSPVAFRLSAVLDDVVRLQVNQAGLKQKLRRAEALIAEGVEQRFVMETLGAPLPKTPTRTVTNADPAEDSQMGKQAEEHRKWVQARDSLIAEVNLQAEPMQRELNALLENLGPKHTTVVHLRAKISKVLGKMASLPPEPRVEGVVYPGERSKQGLAIVEANQDKRLDLTGDASGDKSVVTLLRALRSELKAVTAELERLDPVLETLSTQVAWQEKSLRQQKFVFQEIEQQQTLRKDLILQIQELSGQQHRGEITCEILQSANSGVRVEPVLRGHLLAGGALGIASSAVLFCLFVLSASMAQPEVEAADRSE